MTTLEKLGTIVMGYALLFNGAIYGETLFVSHAAMALGSVLLLAGDRIEAWLQKRFPNVNW